MLNYIRNAVEGVINLFRLYCMVDVTNIDILELCEIRLDLICPDKIWSIIILVIILKCYDQLSLSMQYNHILNMISMVLLSCL